MPCGSPQNKQLAVLFASVVTVPVPCERPSSVAIARAGENSIFELFTKCFRRSTRDNSRDGLSPLDMSKALEQAGFVSVRIRNPDKYPGAPEGKNSFFVYGSRRWRNPDNGWDLGYLQASWSRVNQHAKEACPLAVVLQHLRDVVSSGLRYQMTTNRPRRTQNVQPRIAAEVADASQAEIPLSDHDARPSSSRGGEEAGVCNLSEAGDELDEHCFASELPSIDDLEEDSKQAHPSMVFFDPLYIEWEGGDMEQWVERLEESDCFAESFVLVQG